MRVTRMPEFIPQCNPAALVAELRPQLDAAIARVLEGGPYILGPEVEAFEAEWASWCGVEHAVGCANGTDALELILRSLDLPAGSRVLADVDPHNYGLDPAYRAVAVDPVAADGAAPEPGSGRSGGGGAGAGDERHRRISAPRNQPEQST